MIKHKGKPIENIVIVGGGTAGWMAACLLAKSWQAYKVNIVLIESQNIGTIGVGEGTTPTIKQFFDLMEIKEQDWMPQCHATYKSGIEFKNWSTHKGYESYFHPFFSQLDQYFDHEFQQNTYIRRQGFDVKAHPDLFFATTHIGQKHKAPIAPDNFPFYIHYAYHFDSALLAQYLKKVACDLGVQHEVNDINEVNLTSLGDVANVATIDGKVFSADLFVDCSGFRSMILGKILNVPYESFADTLLNDAAVTIATDISETIPSTTTSTALSCGWAWKIPLTNRFGNGYVYSSQFLSPEEAEKELKHHLGLPQDTQANHLKMRVGRYAKGWEKNCVALGLSQGFIEPLEATALHFVAQSLIDFVACFTHSDGQKLQQEYNEKLVLRYEGIKDYIELHYLTNSRNDNDYWKKVRSHTPSPVLADIINTWHTNQDVVKKLTTHNVHQLWSPISWLSLFAGTGQFPPVNRTKSSLPAHLHCDMNKINNFIAQSTDFYPNHKEALSRLKAAPK